MTKDFKFIAKFYKKEMMTQQIEKDDYFSNKRSEHDKYSNK